jgi:hypothetical protein
MMGTYKGVSMFNKFSSVTMSATQGKEQKAVERGIDFGVLPTTVIERSFGRFPASQSANHRPNSNLATWQHFPAFTVQRPPVQRPPQHHRPPMLLPNLTQTTKRPNDPTKRPHDHTTRPNDQPPKRPNRPNKKGHTTHNLIKRDAFPPPIALEHETHLLWMSGRRGWWVVVVGGGW